MKSWEKLSSELILNHKRMKVYEDQVKLPSGEITDYVHYGEGKDAACIIAISDEGKILLQKEYNYPTNEWLYQLPAGVIKKGENPEAGADRELAEEAGLSGDFTFLGNFYLNYRKDTSQMYVYACQNLVPKTALKDAEEEFEEFWLSPEEISSFINERKIVVGSSLASWMLYVLNSANQLSK